MDKLIIGLWLCIIVFFTPFAAIWALNTLFNLNIDYTFKTWISAFVLTAIVSPTVNVNKK